MDSQRFEVESEAWYRAVAEGRIVAGSDAANRPLTTADAQRQFGAHTSAEGGTAERRW